MDGIGIDFFLVFSKHQLQSETHFCPWYQCNILLRL